MHAAVLHGELQVLLVVLGHVEADDDDDSIASAEDLKKIKEA